MKLNKSLVVSVGALVILATVAGLAFASDASPTEEPAASPYFDATLQQAVDELDGKAQVPAARAVNQTRPTEHYTTDPQLWHECQFGYTRDLLQWPWCHYTSDPNDADCDNDWPTKDYTWDASIWQECDPTGGGITQDPSSFWCDPGWTRDPQIRQCGNPIYTRDATMWPWCNPRYTWDPAQWPNACPTDVPYTSDEAIWPECDPDDYTKDPHLWRECHFTSDPRNPQCEPGYPTADYTSSPAVWPECDPGFTADPNQPPCENPDYTMEAMPPWCMTDTIPYTGDPYVWSECHFTSNPTVWPDHCQQPFPTKDYTFDANLWPECDNFTQDPDVWHQCSNEYTTDPVLWPWCAPNWTWDPDQWPECLPGYTNDPRIWPECDGEPYTHDPQIWPECRFFTADARIWPECHYTSDAQVWSECLDTPFPTKDYTTDIFLWPECEQPPDFTTDPYRWPACHYTSDPVVWDECHPEEVEVADLGDAPDSTNHFTPTMTAYPAGGPPGTLAAYPTVFDPATGLPSGPKHWFPRGDAWLGPWVTVENDADLMPDEDGLTNIEPLTDTPNRDGADDGLLYPVTISHCTSTVISYTVTVTPGAAMDERYVNVWFDWNRDGDWGDVFTCTQAADAPEWAVQNQVTVLGPGVHVLQTPAFLPYNATPLDPTWMRISIADVPAPLVPGAVRADGRGPDNGYVYGETEDYYLPGEKEEPDYDIYLKDNASDLGAVPSSSPWWNSPDVWVRNDGDCTNTNHENPTAGSSTTVCVRVRNRMTATVTNTTVDVYWANAALTLSWPGSWSYIGNVHIPSLAGGAVTTKSLTWNVPFITGHFCLLARADALQDPIGFGPDTVAPVDKTKNNNNIAQRNANIVDYPEVTECGFYTTTVATDTFLFDAVNPWNKSVVVDIEFDSADFPIGTGTLLVEPGSLWSRWTSLTNFGTGVDTLTATGLPATMSGISMMPGETARMTMTVAAEIDYDFTIEVTEIVTGTEIGGIDYVRDLPDCIYLPIILKNY